MDGEGQVSALSPVCPFLASGFRIGWSLGSALTTAANGSDVHFGGGAVVLLDGVAEPVADAVVEPVAFVVPVGVFVALGEPEADVVGAVSGRCRASLPDLEAEELLGLGLALGLVDRPADGPAVLAPGARQPTGTSGMRSPRKFRIAALPSRATSVSVALGISTTSWSGSWTTTVAPVTPVLLMRSSRICRAWVIWDDDGFATPSGTCAEKTTRIPPTRSMPSFGVCRLPGKKTTR